MIGVVTEENFDIANDSIRFRITDLKKKTIKAINILFFEDEITTILDKLTIKFENFRSTCHLRTNFMYLTKYKSENNLKAVISDKNFLITEIGECEYKYGNSKLLIEWYKKNDIKKVFREIKIEVVGSWDNLISIINNSFPEIVVEVL